MPPLPEPLAQLWVGTSPHPPKRERTRRQLLQAAVQVLSARGLAGASVQEIARVAGMATGTVYNHFSTREEIVEALAWALINTLNERIVQSYAAIEDGAERMAIGMRRFLWLADTNAQWTLLLLELSAAHPDVLEGVMRTYPQTDLRLGVAQGRFSFPSEDAALHMVFGAIPLAMTKIASGHVAEPQHYMRMLVQMILVGLGMDTQQAAEVVMRPLPPFETPTPEADPFAAARAGRSPPRPRRTAS